MSERPPIPDPVKRAVRQACGFGCVLCGHPIYQYDHMVPYAVNEEHAITNLCLLCNNHHAEKTKGLLPSEKVAAARANPINLKTGLSGIEALHYFGNKCSVRLGSNIACNSLSQAHGMFGAIVILNEVLLQFRIEDEQLLLSMLLKNSKGEVLLHIADNELNDPRLQGEGFKSSRFETDHRPRPTHLLARDDVGGEREALLLAPYEMDLEGAARDCRGALVA